MTQVEIKEWEVVGEEPVYSGHRKVVRRTVRMPGGKQADFDLVQEGKVVCVLALTPDNQVILARQFRVGPWAWLDELPGGGVGKDEEPLQAAARELLEETGYAGELEFVATSLHSAQSTMTRYNFVARNCRKVAAINNPEPDEATEVVLMPLADFREHARSGHLTDMGTAYRCLDHLGLL